MQRDEDAALIHETKRSEETTEDFLGAINVWPIIKGRFYIFDWDKGDRFSILNTVLFALLPITVGIWICALGGVISEAKTDIFMTLFSVVAAVLTCFLGVVHSLFDKTTAREYKPGEWKLWRDQASRIDVLKELYSSICFAILILVLSLIPLLLIKLNCFSNSVNRVFSGFVFACGASVAISFLQMISRVHLVVAFQTKELSDQIRNKRPPDL